MSVLCTFERFARSADHAVLSTDRSPAQQSVDRAGPVLHYFSH